METIIFLLASIVALSLSGKWAPLVTSALKDVITRVISVAPPSQEYY